MADKPFHELTTEEAIDLAKSCMLGAKSEAEIRHRLTEAGFNGTAAALASTSHTSHGRTLFMAMGMVHGPKGETIHF